MTAYYNEIDPYAAQWLRNLITAGHIADGVVDTRSIEDVQPDDLREFTQCHFFAGVGVWSHALRATGWGDDRPVWTGSCPCQPFSQAGEGAGFADERHLWPAFHHLTKELRPSAVLGEQVASSHVDAWIDLVHADLEGMGYTFGAIPFPSAGIGAPHIRDRLYWAGTMADAVEGKRGRRANNGALLGDRTATGRDQVAGDVERGGSAGGLAYAGGGVSGSQATTTDHWEPKANGPADRAGGRSVLPGRVADAECERRERGQGFPARGIDDWAHAGRLEDNDGPVGRDETGVLRTERAGPTNGLWRDADWLACTDGKWRPVEPGTFPLAHGAASRVGRLRAYGNAINAEAARVWIEAVMEGV
ncbi:MAG TPA: DNA cytosine methyltransferase [Telluria sp.]